MSLQVWLPLTKDLRQQGLKNISASIGGTVGLTDVGKLGKCATIGAAAGGITLPASAMTSFTECSVAFWINITSWNTDWDTIFQAGLGSTPWNNYIFGILRNQGNYLCFTVSNGSSTSRGSYASSNLTVGQWMHLAFTYGSGKCKIYINGVLDKEYSTSITPNFAGITHITIGRSTNGSSYQSKCKLNDFRIYDHCLSPMEVKQISQGLVLHYLLNSNSNLQIPFGYQQLEYIEGAGSSYFNTNYRFNPETDGCTVEFKGNDTSNTGMIFADSGAKYFWFYYYGSSGIRVYADNGSGQQGIAGISSDLNKHVMRYENKHYYIDGVDKGSLSKTYSDDTNTIWLFTYGGGSYGFKGRIYYTEIRRNGIIQRIYIPVKRLSDSAIGMYEVLNSEFFTSASTAFTAGPIINTPSIIYDNSGYCHNGTSINTTLSSSSNTIKYKDSIDFNGTYDGILIENLQLSDIINTAVTYAFWIKPESESGARSVYFGSYNTGPSWSIEKTTGNVMRSYWNGSPDETCSGTTITDGVWQHVCLTKNGTNDIKVYINGVQKWASTSTHSNLNFPTTYRIGRDVRSNDGTPYKGLMSDFRIYATALSADDVKSLYQNNAYIDSSGNIYGAVHSEV